MAASLATNDRVHVAVRIRPFINSETQESATKWATVGDTIELLHTREDGEASCTAKYSFGMLHDTLEIILRGESCLYLQKMYTAQCLQIKTFLLTLSVPLLIQCWMFLTVMRHSRSVTVGARVCK